LAARREKEFILVDGVKIVTVIVVRHAGIKIGLPRKEVIGRKKVVALDVVKRIHRKTFQESD